jgi:intracellular sulfur oxidation DsrE/DsrF family protein
MTQTLQTDKKHKQVFQSVSPLLVAPGVASIYIHMQNAMNAYETSFGYGPGSLATLAVLIGPSIVFALNDAMWTKYKIGPTLNLDATNTYYRADSTLDASASPDDPNGMYQDWSAQAVLKRGGSFMVCHNATTAVAGLFAQKNNADAKMVLADFKQNMLPGFKLVPAGVAAVHAAQENGWQLYPII